MTVTEDWPEAVRFIIVAWGLTSEERRNRGEDATSPVREESGPDE